MLDRKAPLPLVYQTEEYLCQIIAEKYPLGSLIPTQHELADILGVSRITVRNALEALKKRGVIDSHRGKGTVVVAVPKISSEPSVELFDFPMIQPTAIEQAICGSISYELGNFPNNIFPKGSRAARIERSYYKDKALKDPLAWEECLWDSSLLPPKAKMFRPVPALSLYSQLEKAFHLKVSHCKESIEPRMSSNRLCDFFKLPGLAPLLCIKRFSYVGERLFEYRETLIRHEDFGIFVYKANK